MHCIAKRQWQLQRQLVASSVTHGFFHGADSQAEFGAMLPLGNDRAVITCGQYQETQNIATARRVWIDRSGRLLESESSFWVLREPLLPPLPLPSLRVNSDTLTPWHAACIRKGSTFEPAGFDGIQPHAAHGYLLTQFFSQTTNLRADTYSGSLENHAHIITETADEIRAQARHDFLHGIKINSPEFQQRGFSAEEAAQLCELLEAHRFDFAEPSCGTYEDEQWTHPRNSIMAREAFCLEFADNITAHLNETRSFITDGLRTVGSMRGALQSTDGVGLA